MALRTLFCGLISAALAVLSPAAAQFPQANGVSQPAALAPLLAGPTGIPTNVRPDERQSQAAAATFVVTYVGFPVGSARRAAFQRAVNLWAPLITSSVPITVRAIYEPLPAGFLGFAGSSKIFRDFTGAPRPGTWYVDAIANKRFGSQLDPTPDIVARFSSVFSNWHFGATPAPAGKYDFTTVVMHELGHGLGFLGMGRVTGATGSVRNIGFPSAYDRFTENGAGRTMLSFADASTTLAAQLTGNNLFFDSARVRAANRNQRAKLFAPNPFQQGSSYSHLDETLFSRGNAHSLMTPVLGQGETIRNPGGITRAIFRDIGW